jgi:hypothetical protein
MTGFDFAEGQGFFLFPATSKDTPSPNKHTYKYAKGAVFQWVRKL